VPLVHTRLGAGTIALNGRPATIGRDLYLSTVRPIDRVAIAKAPMVFVGYGVTAPERKWDDFKGTDLAGKVAVFLVNDPDISAASGEPVAGTFGGRTMTYYGRWTYKYEEAARRGAIAALIVHDMLGAGYGWSTVIAPGGENYDIVRPASEKPRVMLQGWIEGAAATDLFARAGLDLAKLRVAARRADFRPVPLPGPGLTAEIAVTQDRVESQNLLAKISGSRHPDETIARCAGTHDPAGCGRRRDRRRGRAGDCARVQGRAATRTDDRVRAVDGGGARAARLRKLCRASAVPAGEDGRQSDDGRVADGRAGARRGAGWQRPVGPGG
jgi:hypothetical protein